MAVRLRPQEIAAVSSLPGPERYAHFVKRVADTEAVWGLRTAEGWVVGADDAGREAIPFWPFAEYAVPCATDAWAGTEPAAIPLDEFLERWLPGMERDGRLVAVFPVAAGRGVAVEPARLREDLARELEWYK